MLERMPGEGKSSHSADSVEQQDDGEDGDGVVHYPIEFLNSINASGLPLAHLKLKVGAPIMILRNIDPSQGMCNGTRAILTRCSDRVLEVCLLGGTHNGKTAFIPRITCTAGEGDTGIPFELKRCQFPVHLAFAMTVNKSQGQSVKIVGLDLRTPVFTHGQLYVAMSRVTSSQRITAIFPEDQDDTHTTNIVYPEVLLD
jgi:ATP-dependent exoDNAse (exonuclease V) alpha subunit